jgi:hypothetical protein
LVAARGGQHPIPFTSRTASAMALLRKATPMTWERAARELDLLPVANSRSATNYVAKLKKRGLVGEFALQLQQVADYYSHLGVDFAARRDSGPSAGTE